MKIEMWESVNLKKYIGGDTSGLTKLCKLYLIWISGRTPIQ